MASDTPGDSYPFAEARQSIHRIACTSPGTGLPKGFGATHQDSKTFEHSTQ